MVKLTAEMKEVFSKNKIFAIATASKAGIPNVAPDGLCPTACLMRPSGWATTPY